MSERRVARRYVEGFLLAVREQGLIDRAEEALRRIDTVLHEHKEVRRFLYHPTIPRSRKQKLLRSIAGDGLPEVFIRFLDLIIEKKRERILEHVYAVFREAADSLRGIVRATVTAATDLSDAQRGRLQAEFETLMGKKVVFDTRRDPSLIGGLRVMVGTHIFDGTVTGRLQRLQKHLLENVGTLRTEP